MEARSPKPSGHWQCLAFLGLQPPHSRLCLRLHMASSSPVFPFYLSQISLCLCLKGRLPLDLGPTQVTQDDLLMSGSLIISAKTPFQNKVTFAASGGLGMATPFGWVTIHPNIGVEEYRQLAEHSKCLHFWTARFQPGPGTVAEALAFCTHLGIP